MEEQACNESIVHRLHSLTLKIDYLCTFWPVAIFTWPLSTSIDPISSNVTIVRELNQFIPTHTIHCFVVAIIKNRIRSENGRTQSWHSLTWPLKNSPNCTIFTMKKWESCVIILLIILDNALQKSVYQSITSNNNTSQTMQCLCYYWTLYHDEA